MEEAERLPEWRSTLKGGISDSAEKLERKTAELKMAGTLLLRQAVLLPPRYPPGPAIKN